MSPSLKLLTIVEATTINAVAKGVLEFNRSASDLNRSDSDFPAIEGCIATFARQSSADTSPSEFVAAARAQGLEVEVISERRRFDLSVIPALRDLVARSRPDVILTNSVKSHFVLWRSRLWRKYPWVAFHHGYTDTDRKMRLYNLLDRWSLPHADRLVTVCRAFAEDLRTSTGVPADRVSVQHNSIRRQPTVDPVEVAKLRKNLGLADGEQVLLSIGRLSREKAHLDLLHSFKCLLEKNPKNRCRLVIAGDGPERTGLEAAAESLGLKEQVVFTGQVEDVRPFYALADVFVLPSHSEGSPNVLLEAMALNVPVVATAVGGVPEMVEGDKSALLVPPRDPIALSTAIMRLLIDREFAKHLTITAAGQIATRFTPESYVRAVVEIYREVIKARKT